MIPSRCVRSGILSGPSLVGSQRMSRLIVALYRGGFDVRGPHGGVDPSGSNLPRMVDSQPNAEGHRMA